MKRIFFPIIAALLFASCEEVIEIDLNDSDPTLVVEGTIELGQRASIVLTETSSYFDESSSNTVEDAYVILTSSTGEIEVLNHQENGLYVSQNTVGVENMEYQLTIEHGDNEYEAITTLNPPVEITRLVAMESMGPESKGLEFQVLAQFLDDPNSANYYRLRYYTNGIHVSGVQGYLAVTDDLASTDDLISTSLRRKTFKSGKKVTVELLTVDKATYEYFNTLADNLNSSGINSSAPFNPTSNISNGALGYFSAWAVTSKEIQL